MGKIDSRHLKEAADYVPATTTKINFIKLVAIAACLCAVLSISVLGIGYWTRKNTPNTPNTPNTEDTQSASPDLPSKEDAYKDSEYYSVIKLLGNYYDYLDSLPPKDDSNEQPSEDSSSGSIGSYVEVTDNQEQGVIEADLLKRSDLYAYYLEGNEEKDSLLVKVYSIEGTDTAKLTQFHVVKNKKRISDEQLYLSSDCQTLTVLFECHEDSKGYITEVYTYDVSDLTAITQKSHFSIKGTFKETRMAEDELILVTYFTASAKDRDYSDISRYIPSYHTENKEVFLTPDEIYYPETIHSSGYLVFSALDAKTLSVKGTTALLSYSRAMYFTDDTVYASYNKKSSENKTQTVLSALQYKGEGGMKMLGSVTVNGTIHNQYSMDEHKGILRVVTSANNSADLYCISLDDYTVKAQVIGFAPKWETVRSVRFDGDYAYVCTAVQMSDPVFFFDLSDLSNITYKHTGDIPGFSHSLVDFGNGHLLGIGYDENDELERCGKIEIYKESENGVVSVCQYIVDAWIENDYKAYFIDRENGLVGFMYQQSTVYDTYMHMYLQRYILLSFDGSKLNVMFDHVVKKTYDYSSVINKTRAFSDGDYLYVFANSDILEIYTIIPNVTKQSTLDFYIGQNVDDVDFSEYEIRDLGFSADYVMYYGKGYSATETGDTPKQCVWYAVSSYPNLENEEKHIKHIFISDPAVKLWGMTVNSSAEKFTATMMAKGFEIEKRSTKYYIATKGNCTVSFSLKEKTIEINLLVTNENGYGW